MTTPVDATMNKRQSRTFGPTAHFFRVAWAGLSFILFGIGAIGFGLAWFPMLYLFIRNAERRTRVARSSVSVLFGGFIRFMAWVLFRYDVSGAERIAQSRRCVVVANHPSLIDAVFLMWLFRGADCVVKSAHWRNPVMMFAVRAARYLPNDDDEYLITTAVQRVRDGSCLLLFPEGTRTPPGRDPHFKRGAAVIASRAGADLIPVRITCQPPVLRKGEPWYAIPRQGICFHLEVLPRLRHERFCDFGVSEKTRTKAIMHYLKNQLIEPLD